MLKLLRERLQGRNDQLLDDDVDVPGHNEENIEQQEGADYEQNMPPGNVAIINGDGIDQLEVISDDEDSDEEDEDIYSYHRFERHPVTITDTKYRWFFLLAGLLSPKTLRKHSLCFAVSLCVQRFLIITFMFFFFMVKFGLWFNNMSWLVLESKYPFTVINYGLWELRWVLTYFLSLHFLSKRRFDKFLRGLELPIEKWRTYRRKLSWYTTLVVVVLVIIPCIFIMLDINWFDVNKRNTITVIENIVISFIVILFRLLVLPGFCMLTVILYLLGEHIVTTGKRVCKQQTIYDAERLIIGMRKFIVKTEESLSVMVFVHMLLIFSSSFTTLMSTIERLELTYNRTNSTTSSVKLNFHEDTLPISDLIQTNMALIDETKFQLQRSGENPSENPKELNATDLNAAYKIIKNLRNNQMKLMEYIIKNRNNKNVSATFSEKKPPLYQMVMSITESYNKIRIFLDSAFTMLEILLLYMSPLFLISRTDTKVRTVLDMVLNIDIEEQQELYAVKSYDLKDRLADILKETSGLRICGYRVQFFKSLIMASLGAFFAIALRGIWKHFGFY